MRCDPRLVRAGRRRSGRANRVVRSQHDIYAPADGPSTDPANQDRITDNVWLTRDTLEGIYNIKQETEYDKLIFHAPADTLWATDLNNAGKTIAAANYQDLAFTYWRDAYGGQVGSSIVNRNAVVHLLTDDIYLDLRFTDWGLGGVGGFAYMRAVAPARSRPPAITTPTAQSMPPTTPSGATRSLNRSAPTAAAPTEMPTAPSTPATTTSGRPVSESPCRQLRPP